MISEELEYTGSNRLLQGQNALIRSMTPAEMYEFDIKHDFWPLDVVMAQFPGQSKWVVARMRDFTPLTGKPVF